MASRQYIKKLKTDIERTIQGLRTKPREFRYEDTKSYIKPDTLYSAYYTLDKREVYLTGISSSNNSRIITRSSINTRTLFDRYVNLKFPTRQKYPTITLPNPSESDYTIGSIKRYFAQKANNPNADIFEVSKADFKTKNDLYRYIQFDWRISGIKSEIVRDNQRTINFVNRDFIGISKQLFALQYWKPPKNSPDDLQKKLSLLKTN